MLLKAFIFIIGTTTITASTFQTLFPEQNRLYSYAFKTNVTTGTVTPIEDGSWWCLEGSLLVQVYDDFGRIRVQMEGPKSTTNSKHGESNFQSDEAVHFLTTPWEINSCFTSIHVHAEPEWVTNIKRALSFNFLLASPADSKDTHYTIQEPCLQGICLAVYFRSDSKLRKYYSTIQSGVISSHALHCQSHATSSAWYTTPYHPHHPNYVTSSEREYELDQKTGLVSLEMRSSVQYRTENNLLAVKT
ncbi:uncharacterized protein LOC113239305, partial [Hyposmocoma kahamanoa]|uniref:uncharacterized protein LOC113239305 n=1 Tax=Hyposmocoma kahamanoa TaxID=1477025 RepID=UPI000E6D8862